MAKASSLPDGRLQLIYEGEGLGGEKTMRAKVIRELVDEIRALRQDLQHTVGSRTDVKSPD